jgi:hypothetical protein
MDLRIYYQKVREKRAGITDEFPIVVSEETQDGGRQGTLTEVSRELAAKMLVDGTARLATTDEATQFRERQTKLRKAAEEERAASKVQLTVIPKEYLDQVRKRG